jgi:hypothetical protein
MQNLGNIYHNFPFHFLAHIKDGPLQTKRNAQDHCTGAQCRDPGAARGLARTKCRAFIKPCGAVDASKCVQREREGERERERERERKIERGREREQWRRKTAPVARWGTDWCCLPAKGRELGGEDVSLILSNRPHTSSTFSCHVLPHAILPHHENPREQEGAPPHTPCKALQNTLRTGPCSQSTPDQQASYLLDHSLLTTLPCFPSGPDAHIPSRT